MPELFGLDIDELVADAIEDAGGLLAGTLVKSTPGTRTTGDLTAGTNPTTATHTFTGFLDRKSEKVIGGTLAATGGEFLTILGATIDPPAEPEIGDVATIEGTAYTISEITDRDPAAAQFTCRVGA